MKTNNIEGLTIFEIKQLIQQGGKFVVFPHTISIILKKFKRSSNVYFIRPDENSLKYSIHYFLLNLTIGWWAFPWGPIYTIKSLYFIIKGGKDFTHVILNDLDQNNPVYDPDIHYLKSV